MPDRTFNDLNTTFYSNPDDLGLFGKYMYW